jgi:hypothetical protein
MIGRLLWWAFTRIYEFNVTSEMLDDINAAIAEERLA